MGIKSFITDISSGIKAKVTNNSNTEENALVVATRPLKRLTNKIIFFSNPVSGIDMNQNLSSGGSVVNIHNGIDNIYWTASTIIGVLRWDFNSINQSYTGTYSIDGSSTINSDEAQFTKGSIQDLTGYTSIAGWIFINNWAITGTKEIQIYGWKDGQQIGNVVNIGNYVDTSIFNTWHKFIISLEDLDLIELSIDAIRIKTISLGAGAAPSYYLDDLKIQENELPLEYTIEPEDNTWIYVNQLNITMTDALNTILTDNSMFNLSYNKFLGLSRLNNGILFHLIQNGIVTEVFTFHMLLDFLQIPNTNILTAGCDGVNTWFSLSQGVTSPVLLKSETKDKMAFVIRDDMDGLLNFRIGISCEVEQR